MQAAKRFFNAFVRPGDIVEHPTTLPTTYELIPLGPIFGWEAFAPNFGGDPHSIIGPFRAEVIERYNQRCIAVSTHRNDESLFFYGNGNTRPDESYPKHPCWHQSCCTLRFTKKFIPWTDDKDAKVVLYSRPTVLKRLAHVITAEYGGKTGDLIPVYSELQHKMVVTLPNDPDQRKKVWDIRKNPEVSWDTE